jgi:hypothetical protein
MQSITCDRYLQMILMHERSDSGALLDAHTFLGVDLMARSDQLPQRFSAAVSRGKCVVHSFWFMPLKLSRFSNHDLFNFVVIFWVCIWSMMETTFCMVLFL